MATKGFAVAALRDAGEWRVEPLPLAVLTDLGVLLQALRAQTPEGGPFVVASVDEEFFVIARQEGQRFQLLLSDLTASVEYPLAEQVRPASARTRPRTTSSTRCWPVGDLELFADLDLSEDEMEQILEDVRRLPRRDARHDPRPARAG